MALVPYGSNRSTGEKNAWQFLDYIEPYYNQGSFNNSNFLDTAAFYTEYLPRNNFQQQLGAAAPLYNKIKGLLPYLPYGSAATVGFNLVEAGISYLNEDE